MKNVKRLPLYVMTVSAGLTLSACDADWGLLAEAMAAEANCTNCTFEQKRQYMDQNNPQRVAQQRNDELSMRRNNYSAPHTYRCRYENYSDDIPVWTEDIRVQNGEWYFGRAGSPNTPAYCNSAYVNASGNMVESTCSLDAAILRREVVIGGAISSTVIYQGSGRSISTTFGLGRDRSIEGRCTPVT